MKNWLLVVCLLGTFSIFSQQNVTRKQRAHYQSVDAFIQRNDTTQLYTSLNNMSVDFMPYLPMITERWIEQLTQKVVRLETNYRAKAYSVARQFYLNTSNQHKILENTYLEYKALSSMGNSRNMLWILIDLGNVFYAERDFERSREFYQKAASIALKYHEPFARSVSYLNEGLIFFEQKRYPEAIRSFRASAQLRLTVGNQKMACYPQIKETLAWAKLHEVDSATAALRRAQYTYQHLGTEDPQLITMRYHIRVAQSFIFYEQKRYSEALQAIDDAIAEAERSTVKIHIFGAVYQKATVLCAAKAYAAAKTTLEELLPSLERDSLLTEMLYVYQQLSSIHQKLNNPEKANEYLQKIPAINEQIINRNNNSELHFMRTISATYESDLKLQQARQHLHVIQATKDKEKLQRNLAIFISSILIVSLGVILSLFLKVRKNQLALRILNDQLRQSNEIISFKSSQLERSNQIKDKLFSIIAHDLRNPLNRMSVEIAIAKRMLTDKSVIQPVENTLRETISLFERLLQWSKMETKQHIYLPVSVDLNENINKVVAFYLPEIKLRNIEINNTNQSYFVHVDPNFLQTLLRNIISNSISAVLKNGVVKIDVTDVDDSFVTLRVQDSGKGFPTEVIQYFNKPEANLNEVSTGLGLILCKELVKISGWQMQIDNGGELDGATILLRLPRSTETEPASVAYEKLLADIQLSQPWKEKLWPITAFKFYQVSQIRQFLKGVELPMEKDVKLWRDAVEKSVHDGNAALYQQLMEKLK